ncbi:MAG: hypothetical protein AMJ46_09135 [Latescibacteria bacterium DG_63]|nr:MAG: hypothetical protein AMJ46_09135 [Latescibacteria bacterium DG_63]
MLAILKRLRKKVKSGESLHIKALKAAELTEYERAMELFEEAAGRYREEESVERLARLRAHQLMVKYRTEESTIEKEKIVEEVVLRLSKLREIESLEPPFELLDARAVLRSWMEEKTFVIGASSAESSAGIEEEAILAELESALPCELIGAIANGPPEAANEIKE